MAIYHHTTRMISRSKGGSPVKALAYAAGIELTDQRTGEAWNYQHKTVQDVQILLPENAPGWARDLQKLVNENREAGIQLLSDIANAAEKRGDAQVYREMEFSLLRELTDEQNRALANEYVQDQFCDLGMLAIQNFHTEMSKTGEPNPHCHTFLLTRELVEEGLSEKKNRDWNRRELHEVWREQWAQYASRHLKMHGHDITLDHRSYKSQGLDIEPQIKLGKGVVEQEKRANNKEDKAQEEKNLNLDHDLNHPFLSPQGQSFVESRPSTERGKRLRAIQLRNLYRIMRRPETVFDIVTRHHATFMWGDVQKILGRYVDDAELFQRMDARLRNSKELILLKMDGVKNQEGHLEEKAIYTTRSMLKTEKELVGRAESLAATQVRGVTGASLDNGLNRMKEKLQAEGYTLSEGQENAIRHLTQGGQLKCIVGYAGAGKTTALEAAKDIWEADGYKVYGLAPTGRAAQNLEGSGIRSQTLHKFLKSFEEGRCRYSDKSVLVLDEAGMVDIKRFESFLGAVKALGVKAVVVGDSGQLQPVEAGPAFRLVTERVGASRLEEIVRQKEGWQKDASVLFGRGQSGKAIQAYMLQGHVHVVEEPLTRESSALSSKPEDVLRRYEVSARTSGLIFREIMKEVREAHTNEENVFKYVAKHQDYSHFTAWRESQKAAAREILDRPDFYRKALEERRLDPLEMARLFVNKEKDKASQYSDARALLVDKKLDHLIGAERTPGQGVEVRSAAKVALIQDWQKAYQKDPSQSLLMMAYSNRDVADLNTQARGLLKTSGALEKAEVSYTIVWEVEDDFGRRKLLKGEKGFARGDRIVFTRNNRDLGVKNGSIGTVVSLSRQSIEVKLDSGPLGDSKRGPDEKNTLACDTLTFSPHLFPYFDQGWAVTIHKSQGVTVDKSFVLVSHEMNQNLTYVAMTRHREDVHVYGSTLDFWREEKVPEVLSKSGEKLGAADYLDAASLSKLMKDEDRFLNKLFTRLGDELQAMRAVGKRSFERVADYFLGRESESHREQIFLKPETVREEMRAEEILQKIAQRSSSAHMESLQDRSPSLSAQDLLQNIISEKEKTLSTVQEVYEDWKHPAFNRAGTCKETFRQGIPLYGEHEAIQYWQSKRGEFLERHANKLQAIEKVLASRELNYLSEKTREISRQEAFKEPDEVLGRLTALQASKVREEKEREEAFVHAKSECVAYFKKEPFASWSEKGKANLSDLANNDPLALLKDLKHHEAIYHCEQLLTHEAFEKYSEKFHKNALEIAQKDPHRVRDELQDDIKQFEHQQKAQKEQEKALQQSQERDRQQQRSRGFEMEM